MSFILLFLIKFSVSITTVFLFYYFVLRRLTFYNWNRVYLVAGTALSFVIAFMNIQPALQRSSITSATWIEWLPPVGVDDIISSQQNIVPPTGVSWSINEWAVFIMLAGMVIMLLRLCIQFFSVRRMMRSAEHFSENGVHFYQVKENIIPFSFGNAIFVNKGLHTESELQRIISHEFVHVQQRHSVDILWAEILCIINWYDPFIWLIRKAVRQNLEFIADDEVLRTGIEKKQYQYLLLKVVGNEQFAIASKFNFSSLKERIVMMNKNRTEKRHLAKFLLMLPLVTVLLLAFRKNAYMPLAAQQMGRPLAEKMIDPPGTASQQLAQAVPPTAKKITPAPLVTRPAAPGPKQGFTGLQGVINTGEGNEDVRPKFVTINGKLRYYTQTGNKTTYYDLYGKEIDSNGKLLSTTQTNASSVLPNQYILNVFKDGELISAFNDDKGSSMK